MYILEVEGITGAGKTTMIPFIKKHLEKKGYHVLSCKEPGTTPLGLRIRGMLQGNFRGLGREAQMFLFLANRADLAAGLVDKKADIILFDRFYGSTVVYQTMFNVNSADDQARRQQCLMSCMRLMYREPKFSPPVNTTLLLDVSEDNAWNRVVSRIKVAPRGTNELGNKMVFLNKNKSLRRLFNRYLVEFHGARNILKVNANGCIEHTKEMCLQALDSILDRKKNEE